MEEEVKQVKMKLRQTERELEELKVRGRGVENGEQSERKKVQNFMLTRWHFPPE
jgi:hypothetical protein